MGTALPFLLPLQVSQGARSSQSPLVHTHNCAQQAGAADQSDMSLPRVCQGEHASEQAASQNVGGPVNGGSTVSPSRQIAASTRTPKATKKAASNSSRRRKPRLARELGLEEWRPDGSESISEDSSDDDNATRRGYSEDELVRELLDSALQKQPSKKTQQKRKPAKGPASLHSHATSRQNSADASQTPASGCNSGSAQSRLQGKTVSALRSGMPPSSVTQTQARSGWQQEEEDVAEQPQQSSSTQAAQATAADKNVELSAKHQRRLELQAQMQKAEAASAAARRSSAEVRQAMAGTDDDSTQAQAPPFGAGACGSVADPHAQPSQAACASDGVQYSCKLLSDNTARFAGVSALLRASSLPETRTSQQSQPAQQRRHSMSTSAPVETCGQNNLQTDLQNALRRAERVRKLEPYILKAISNCAAISQQMQKSEQARDDATRKRLKSLKAATEKAERTVQLQKELQQELAQQRTLTASLAQAEQDIRKAASASIQAVCFKAVLSLLQLPPSSV